MRKQAYVYTWYDVKADGLPDVSDKTVYFKTKSGRFYEGTFRIVDGFYSTDWYVHDDQRVLKDSPEWKAICGKAAFVKHRDWRYETQLGMDFIADVVYLPDDVLEWAYESETVIDG